jgi:thiol-disulfide isomerase/thioredoxin
VWPVAQPSTAKEQPTRPKSPRGIVVDPRVLLIGAAAAALGIAVFAVFMWMVPSAAAREARAACAGLKPSPPNPAVCPDGKPCALPVLAPDFTAVDNNGKAVHLRDFRGKVVLLNFWASWCGVCKTEKPAINAMADDLAGDQFQVVALASDNSWADVLVALVDALDPAALSDLKEVSGKPIELAEALRVYKKALPSGTPFNVFLDPPADGDNIGKIAASWGIKAVPESFLIDRRGYIRAYFVNKRDWQSPVAETCLRSVIDE